MWHGAEWRRIFSLLLLAVFLAAQTASLAHDVGHGPGAHDDACLTCHVSKNADAALVAAAPTLPVLVAAIPLPQAARARPPAHDGRTKNIRAPPSFLIA